MTNPPAEFHTGDCTTCGFGYTGSTPAEAIDNHDAAQAHEFAGEPDAAPATFRTAQCSTCGMAYFGTSTQDALRQHHTVEGHELTTSRVNGEWTAGVYVVITDDATDAPITDIIEVARLLAIHCAMEIYPFEIEADEQELGGWLVTVEGDAYMTASEEGGLDIYIDGHEITIPMS